MIKLRKKDVRTKGASPISSAIGLPVGTKLKTDKHTNKIHVTNRQVNNRVFHTRSGCFTS